MRTIQHMLDQEVLCCMSGVVSTFAQDFTGNDREARLLIEQATDLASPIPDYESAAIDAGWTESDNFGSQQVFVDATDGQTWCAASWEALCTDHDIEPYDREVYEHWAVTQWFADKLREAGEKVDDNFAGLCVWARTTTGQAIHADHVIEQIYAATHRDAA